MSQAIASTTTAEGGVNPIDATHAHRSQAPVPRKPSAPRVAWAFAALALVVIGSLWLPDTASAGHSSTGKPAFFPCTRCHPVTIGADGKPTKALPSGLTKHEIALEMHDVLGKDEAACLACHDQPTRNPGMLLTPDGTLVEITGDVSRVCQKCHFEKYREWQAGIHGKRQPKCSAAGCHDPHTPSWIYVPALPPFLGTGIEVRAVSNRVAFKPMASPPVPPAVQTPTWLVILTSLAALLVGSILGFLTLGRPRP